MGVEIREARKSDAGLWDSIVQENPTGTTFHLFDWIHITEKHTGTRLHPLFVYEGSEVIGIIPLFSQNRKGISLVLSPPAHSGVLALGPVLHRIGSRRQQKQEQLHTKFWSAVDSFVTTELKADYIRIALPFDGTDPRPYKWTGYSLEPAFDYVIDLMDGKDKLWSNLSHDIRQNIKKSKNGNIDSHLGGRKELGVIYSIMEKRYTEQGMSMPVSLPHILDLYDRFPDNFIVFTGEYEDQIVTGINHILSKDLLFTWIGNPKSSVHISPPPNDLVRWQSILYACEHGLSHYVQMGAAGNVLRHSYFSKFNPRLQMRFYAEKKSFIAGCLEKTYSGIVKPVKARLSRKIRDEPDDGSGDEQ